MESTKDAGDKKRKRAIKVEPGTAAGDAKADPKKLRVRTLYLYLIVIVIISYRFEKYPDVNSSDCYVS